MIRILNQLIDSRILLVILLLSLLPPLYLALILVRTRGYLYLPNTPTRASNPISILN